MRKLVGLVVVLGMLVGAGVCLADTRITLKHLPYWSVTTATQYHPVLATGGGIAFIPVQGINGLASLYRGRAPHFLDWYRCTGVGAPASKRCPFTIKRYHYAEGVSVVLQVAQLAIGVHGFIYVYKSLRGGYMLMNPGYKWTPLLYTWGDTNSPTPNGTEDKLVKAVLNFARVTNGAVYRQPPF